MSSNGPEMRRKAKIEALRRDIAEGLASGPSVEFDLEAFKLEARAAHAKKKSANKDGDGKD